MSYCRSSSRHKVYAYKSVFGGWTCAGCAHLHTLKEFAEHMQAHVDKEEAPAYVMERIHREQQEDVSADPDVGKKEPV